MRKLQISDREAMEAYFRRNRWDTFYHYFPLIYAMSEVNEEPFEYDPEFNQLWTGKDELLYPASIYRKRVWIGPNKCDARAGGYGWKNELYDVNYIYDLEQTLQIKNFRDNVKKFHQKHVSGGEWHKLDGPDPRALEVVSRWYSTSQRENFTDFGYTMWLLENFHLFPDLRARLLCLDEKAIGFSLWGQLTEGTGIHIISKEVGMPYAQDVLRAFTYQEMKEAGLKYCNDGSDAGEHGIMVYKHKLRPRYIIPIYSWIREA